MESGNRALARREGGLLHGSTLSLGFEFPVSGCFDLLCSPGEPVGWRDIPNGAVQAMVVVVVDEPSEDLARFLEVYWFSGNVTFVVGFLRLSRFSGHVSDRNYAASRNCFSYSAGLT